MPNEIIPYLEMCSREGVSLQRGMNFSLGGTHSVILMSVRAGAPYDDRLEDDGTTLIYEGHDEPNTHGGPDPKSIDQPQFSDSGRPTQNGLFHQAAQDHHASARKLVAWKRDGGKCRECGATDELHFDHIVPVAKGGTSLAAENVQLLCGRHNLEKRDRIV